MNMEASYIIAPLLGGVIGYITNDIAIRMLFRPHKAKYLMGVHIPFTPGIIPKEKGRIAEAIGNAISENLMNKDVLERYLLSEDMVGKVRSSVEEFIEMQKCNNETVEQFLGHYLSEQEIADIAQNVNENLSCQIHSKLNDPKLGKHIAHLAMEHVANKLNNNGAAELLAGLAGVMNGIAAALFGGNIVGHFLSMLRQPAEDFLGSKINDMLRENGKEMTSKLIGDEIGNILATPVARFLEGKDEQLAQVVNTIETVYKTIITDHLPKILDSIDISKIVRERINEMEIEETEKLIFQVMDKELKAIVWLGALLGLVMGSINIFI